MSHGGPHVGYKEQEVLREITSQVISLKSGGCGRDREKYLGMYTNMNYLIEDIASFYVPLLDKASTVCLCASFCHSNGFSRNRLIGTSNEELL